MKPNTPPESTFPRDQLFAEPQPVVDFAFNAAVADVFPDMLRRSVPGYETIISQLGVMSRYFVQPDSHVYDLGCSLGAALLAVATQTRAANVRYIGIDQSAAMIERCHKRLQRHLPDTDVTLQCADIRDTPLQQASLIVLNFTLQFIAPEDRQALAERLYQALLPGGALILSEKTHAAQPMDSYLLNELYMEFKRANGYSELEISQKRTALEHVLHTDTPETHQQRLIQAGFGQVLPWFRDLNFVSLLAVKAS